MTLSEAGRKLGWSEATLERYISMGYLHLTDGMVTASDIFGLLERLPMCATGSCEG